MTLCQGGDQELNILSNRASDVSVKMVEAARKRASTALHQSRHNGIVARWEPLK